MRTLEHHRRFYSYFKGPGPSATLLAGSWRIVNRPLVVVLGLVEIDCGRLFRFCGVNLWVPS
jgi:hypothetical protein